MREENPDGWIRSPESPLLELSLPVCLKGVTARHMGRWDFRERVYERYLPGRLQAIGLLLAAPNTELQLDGRPIMQGAMPIGSFAVPPATRISGRHTGAQEFVQFLFEPDGLAELLNDMSIDPDAFELRATYIPADLTLQAMSARLKACLERMPLLDVLYFDILLQSCLTQLIRRHATHPRVRVLRGESLSPSALRKVIDLIDADLARAIRLPDLAAAAGVSRAHFARAFRNQMGVTPHVYVLQQRVERALALLRGSTVSIATIAGMAGFSDHAHLTRTFRRYLGVVPHAIRH